MKEKIKKKIVWDEHGITEILADILILAMTVVLFAIIFAFVYTLPAPNEATYADFVTDIDLHEPTGATINVTHVSGEDLYKGDTDIYLFQNPGTSGQVVKRLLTQDSGYGIPGPDSTWSPGETWTYNFVGVVVSDELEIKIVDTRAQTLIMSAKLLGAGVNDAPVIMERWYSPKPAVNASTLTIYTNVLDRDGFNDIDSVYANVSPINSSVSSVDFTAVSHTEQVGTFKGEVVIDKGEGIYTLTITAEDSSGLLNRRRIVIDVAYTGLNTPRILERWSIPEVGVNGTDITVFARVEDLDGYDNIEYVTVDIGALENPNGTSHVVSMKDPERDGIFLYSTVTHVAKGDLYRVNFTAQDKTGLMDYAHLNISVKKFNPVIARTWTVPTIGKDQESMTIFAEVSDPDGYSDLLEVMVNLTALNPTLGWHTMFDPEQDGIFEYDLTINITTGGNKTVLFLARDMNGNDVTAQMKVFVSTLNAPVIGPRWTDPSFPDNNSQITIYAMVTDPDGYDDIDTVGVYIAGLNRTLNGSAAWVEMIDPNQDGNFFNISWVDQEAGTYMLEFIATDKGGNMAFATLNFTILPYRPRFLNVWTNPTIGRNGSYIQLFANVMDPNGYNDIANVTVDIVHLNQSLNQSTPVWMEMIDFNRNGTFLNVTKINVNKTGLYSLNFTVKDNSGNIATTNHQLIVTSYKPTIVQAWHVPKPALNGTNVTIYAWVRDDDGVEDISSVRLNVSALSKTLTWVNMTDPKGNGIYSNVTFIDGINATGTYYVTLVATDSTGNSYNTTLGVEISSVAVGEEQGATIVGIVVPNGVSGGGSVYINALAINGTSPDDKIVKLTFQLINGPDLVWPPGSPTGEVEMKRVYEMLFRDPVTAGRTAPYAQYYNDVVYIRFRAYNSTSISPEYKIAEETLTLLVIWDKSGGKVTEGTALEQNVAWISHDQGFVITNNKTNNEMVQVFDSTDPEYEKIWVKIGSNMITNTEKANIWQLRSQSTGEIVAEFSSPNYKFEYDGVLAGYWFFILDINTSDIYSWMMSEPSIPILGGGTKSEYFDVYMKIKDTTDDFFATTSWIIVHGGTLGFSAELIPYYDPGYVPGEIPGPDVDGDGFPDDILRADGGTVDPEDDYIFASTEIIYFRIIMKTYNNPPPADFNQFEMVDFKGNRRISSAEGSGPVGYIARNKGFTSDDYMFAVNLLRADKDPWLIGKSAYTALVKVMTDSDEEYAIIAVNLEVTAPTSIMDVISGRDNVGTGTNVPRYYGDFYENQGGAVWEIQRYAYYEGLTGNRDPYGIIYSVDFEDLDNDDDKDILVVLEGGQNNPNDDPKVVMFDNDGDFGTEVRTDIYTSSTYLYTVVAGDLDGDGDLDIATTGAAGITYIIENEGAAKFSSTPLSVSTGVVNINWDHAIAIGDLDGDFDPGAQVKWGDVVVGTESGLIRISYSAGSWSATTIESTRDYSSVDIADVDGDGDLDIVASARNDGDIWLFTQSGTGSLTFTGNLIVNYAGNILTEVAFGDIDGTGNLDIVVGRGTNLYSYKSDGTQINSDSDFNPTALSGDIVTIGVGNVDGAIQDDVVVATNDGYVYHYRNLGKATEWLRFTVDNLTVRVGGSTKFYSIAIGDANMGGA